MATVLTHLSDNTLQRFNSMAGDILVEGVHWRKGTLFGLPTAAASATTAGSFQPPRTYRCRSACGSRLRYGLCPGSGAGAFF